MQPDGTIKVYMGFKAERGEMADGFAEYKSDNFAYRNIIKRLGGIKPITTQSMHASKIITQPTCLKGFRLCLPTGWCWSA
jgi:hypothetical protein